MKVSQLFISFGLVVAFNSFAANTWAYQTIGEKDKPGALKKESSKYKYHEASTLSGIMVQENKKTGTFLLKFDQLLNQTGFLKVKNNAGKVLYASTLSAAPERSSHILDIGRLNPGLYAIEVKTADATFWKKVRIRK